MIKPVACPRCGKSPVYGELITGQKIQIARVIIFCERHGRIKGLTRLGAILRWNWRCFWERMRRKAK